MCVCVCVRACVCVRMCVYVYRIDVCLSCVHVSSQLTVVELSLFKAVNLYEMTVHLWEGNTPGRTCVDGVLCSNNIFVRVKTIST